MGVAQNSLLGAGAAVGVAANKLAVGLGQISEANDADKNEMMAQRAKMNAEKLKNLRLQNQKLRIEKRILKKQEKNIGGDK